MIDIINAINNRNEALKEEKLTNIVGIHQPFCKKIRYLQTTASVVSLQTLELSIINLMKAKFFHFYSVYMSLCADYAFFKRICSGKDDFSIFLFKEDLEKFKKESGEDSKYVLPEIPNFENEILIHLCFVPLKQNKVWELDFSFINEIIEDYKRLIQVRFCNESKGLLLENPNKIQEFQGRIIETYYNKGRYILLNPAEIKLESQMYWNDRKRRKRWRVKYWNYYKLRYNIDLNLNNCMMEVRAIGTIPNKRIRQADNCFQQFLFEQFRKEEEQIEYLTKIASHYKFEEKDFMALPLELCRVHPMPIELYEIIRNTPIVLSAFNNITSFTSFKESFFQYLFMNPIKSNKLGIAVDPNLRVPLSKFIELPLLAEALTSGAANVCYILLL